MVFKDGIRTLNHIHISCSKQAFVGNKDRNTIVGHVVQFDARYVQFDAISKNSYYCAMRVEIIGCPSMRYIIIFVHFKITNFLNVFLTYYQFHVTLVR